MLIDVTKTYAGEDEGKKVQVINRKLRIEADIQCRESASEQYDIINLGHRPQSMDDR